MINAKVKQFKETAYGFEYYENIFKNIVRIYHDNDTDIENITLVYRIDGLSFTYENNLERATFDTQNLQIEFFETED